MKQAQDITEQLKAKNALEWTGRLNNIRACAGEIVETAYMLAWLIMGRKMIIINIDASCQVFGSILLSSQGGTDNAGKQII